MRQSVRETATVWLQRGFEANAVARLGPLRRRRPVVSSPAYAVVTRREDVEAVLHDDVTYGLPYGPRLTGPFLLGMTGVQHARLAAELRAVVRDDDLDRLRETARRQGQERVDACSDELDVGTDLVHPGLAALVAEYLGVAPDARDQLRWARDMFSDIFLNPGGLPSIRRRAARSAEDYCRYVEQLVDSRPHGPGADPLQPDDVLQRLLARQAEQPGSALDDRTIRDSLIGLAIGWLYHGSKAALLAVDELLDRPRELRAARAAALSDDLPALQRLLWEALRFRPVQPFLLRTLARDATLAEGTERARHVGFGTTLLVGTHSSMWDERVVPDPEAFDASRADAQYLVFGAGPHRCFGEAISKVQLPALLAPLLRADGLRRADGRAGRLRLVGTSPQSLRVRRKTP